MVGAEPRVFGADALGGVLLLEVDDVDVGAHHGLDVAHARVDADGDGAEHARDGDAVAGLGVVHEVVVRARGHRGRRFALGHGLCARTHRARDFHAVPRPSRRGRRWARRVVEQPGEGERRCCHVPRGWRGRAGRAGRLLHLDDLLVREAATVVREAERLLGAARRARGRLRDAPCNSMSQACHISYGLLVSVGNPSGVASDLHLSRPNSLAGQRTRLQLIGTPRSGAMRTDVGTGEARRVVWALKSRA